MRNDAEQLAWEKAQHTGFREGSNRGLTLGFALTGGNSETKNGSAQQSVKVCILRGFLETRILVLRSTQRRHLHQNGQNCGFAVEMTLRGT